MTAASDLFATGQMIGRYRLIRRLAVGGMAEIYLARLPGVGIEGFEKLVVLKRILPQHALDPELLRMFLDEARLSATLTHPHVTEVYDVGTDGEAPFFAMEYVHGANLREIQRAHARLERGTAGGAGTATGRSASGAHAPLGTPASGTPAPRGKARPARTPPRRSSWPTRSGSWPTPPPGCTTRTRSAGRTASRCTSSTVTSRPRTCSCPTTAP